MVIPVTASVSATPMAPMSMVKKMMNGSMSDSNCDAITM